MTDRGRLELAIKRAEAAAESLRDALGSMDARAAGALVQSDDVDAGLSRAADDLELAASLARELGSE